MEIFSRNEILQFKFSSHTFVRQYPVLQFQRSPRQHTEHADSSVNVTHTHRLYTVYVQIACSFRIFFRQRCVNNCRSTTPRSVFCRQFTAPTSHLCIQAAVVVSHRLNGVLMDASARPARRLNHRPLLAVSKLSPSSRLKAHLMCQSSWSTAK